MYRNFVKEIFRLVRTYMDYVFICSPTPSIPFYLMIYISDYIIYKQARDPRTVKTRKANSDRKDRRTEGGTGII